MTIRSDLRASAGTPAVSRLPTPARMHGSRGATLTLRLLLAVIPIALAGYALDDRGFAYLASVPGTPLFAGELILLLGAAYLAAATGYLRSSLHHSVPMLMLLLFVGWGLARTVPLITTYGLDSVRDAALWYYALMAVLVATLVVAVPDLPHRLAQLYTPFIVVLLLWAPLSLILAGPDDPIMPWNGVAFFSHKPGNTAVAAVTAIAFMWLVPTHSLSGRARAVLTGLAVVSILAVGTQNRGGLLAAGGGIALIVTLMGWRRGGRMVAVLALTVATGFLLGWGLNVHIPGNQGRDYSVAQLIDNAVSITQGQDSATLGGTVQFRDQLWSGAIDLATEQGALGTGLGFGPNIAQQLGISIGASDPLRSPHNSHIDILARMGIVGAMLWLGFWGTWYTVMFRRSRDGDGRMSPEQQGLVRVCMVGVAATLINAYFDPALESPPVAMWLWALAGLGMGIVAVAARRRHSDTVFGRSA